MKYATATAFRQALEQRLNDEAEASDTSITRLRKRVAFELLLRRLVIVAPNRWVLKGAFALDLRYGATARMTNDIDLGRADDERAAIEDVAAVGELQLGDYFTFSATRTDAFVDSDELDALRFHVVAQLAGRTFERFVLDIGLSEPADLIPETVETTDLLTFAGIAPIRLPATPIAQHLAEKVHAYAQIYGEQERRSTRPKDLVDILIISNLDDVDARALRERLEATFSRRNGRRPPNALPLPPDSWADRYRDLARKSGVEEDLAAAFRLAAAFLGPVLGGKESGRWDHVNAEWRP